MQTIVMTGATRGIGRIAAAEILRHSAEVHLVVVARGSAAVELAEELGAEGYSVSAITADLASFESIRAAAAEIRNRLESGDLPPLHGFAGNAGVQYTNALTESSDGFESTFAVNVLANHLFLRLLEDRFVAPSRIVITVSDTHFGDFRHNLAMVPGPVWQSPRVLAKVGAFPDPATTRAGRTAYSTSKLAAIYLVHEYARRLPPGVDVISYNPGFVPGTDLARNADPLSRFAMRRILPLMTLTRFASTPRTAGNHLAEVILGKTAAETGSYVDLAHTTPSSPESYDTQREHELWQTAEQLTAPNTLDTHWGPS